MRGSGALFWIAALAVAASARSALAAVTLQDPGTYVVDRAGIINDRVERQLEGALRELEQKTTTQVKVLTVPTTDGEDLFSFVQRHAELWKLGRSGRDNGVLIAVSVKEREDRIHVGYGLESILPDSWCGSLRRQTIVPNFKQGRFSDGLYQGVVAIANRVADDAKVTLTGIPDFRHRGAPNYAPCGAGLVPIIVLIIVISSMSRRNRYYGRWGGGSLMRGLFWGSIINSMMSGGRRSGWGGGRFGGGFGGGFGGSFGGGGRFGGGGAGGRW